MGEARPVQSPAVSVSFVREVRAVEYPYGTAGTLGLKTLVFAPHDTASTIAPEAFRKITPSPPLPRPSPMGLPSEITCTPCGMFYSARVVEVAAMTTNVPGAMVTAPGNVSTAMASVMLQPVRLNALALPL